MILQLLSVVLAILLNAENAEFSVAADSAINTAREYYVIVNCQLAGCMSYMYLLWSDTQ